MDLITIVELEAALGTLEDPLMAARNITALSNYINEYVVDSFELLEDDTKRFQMDVRGELTLPGGPVHGISAIVDPRYQMPDLYIDWDMIGTLYYGLPNQVIDVTYTHGHDGAPQDVKDLVIDGMSSLINGDQNPLEFQVGDVSEKYTPGFIDQFFGQQAHIVLMKYGGGSAYTIEVGQRYYPDYKPHGYLLDPEV